MPAIVAERVTMGLHQEALKLREDSDTSTDSFDDESRRPAAGKGTRTPRPDVYSRPLPKEAIDADAGKVIRRLRGQGYEAYLVGGSVRDLLLDKSPKDFDIATSALPQEVRKSFRNCRIIGRRFRLAHVMFSGGKVIEVATFRQDPHAGFTRAKRESEDLLIRNDNVFGEPHEDALRRDFTINGLFYDLESSEVIDYVQGMPDIERRMLRMIGSPDMRIEEDPVRILRAIKFSARLDLGIEPSLLDAMVWCRESLRRAAVARVLEELLRLLRGGAAERSYYLAWDTGVLSVLLPELSAYLDDAIPYGDPTFERLTLLDEALRDGLKMPDSLLLAALVLGPAQEAMQGSTRPGEDLDDFVQAVFVRLAVPRRLRERLRAILLSQRRLAAGKITTLKRRDFFAEAAWLFALNCKATGQALPDWLEELPSLDEQTARPQRRRRARRPRRHAER